MLLEHYPPAGPDRLRAVQRVVYISLLVNVVLAALQALAGIYGHAFSLVVDAGHTLADVFVDVLVMVVAASAARAPDAGHPYGHGRFETAASFLLGMVLLGIGALFLWAAGERFQQPATQLIHPLALVAGMATLVVKEGLFRYVLRAGKRLEAPLLVANAWHARSDAASSLVVTVGIGGTLAGVPFLEPLAAAIVGFMIISMGVRLAWRAMGELVDVAGLDAAELARVEQQVRAVEGVLGLHNLRSRRMGERILCDLHVCVAGTISVSEGHRIADVVWQVVSTALPQVDEVLVHVDTEDDRGRRGAEVALAGRGEIMACLQDLPAAVKVYDFLCSRPEAMQLHYQKGRLALLFLLPEALASALPADWPLALQAAVPELASVQVMAEAARYCAGDAEAAALAQRRK